MSLVRMAAATTGRKRLAAPVAVALAAFFISGCAATASPESSPEPKSQMPASPVTDRLLRCVEDAGWEAKRSWTGGIESSELSRYQRDQYVAVLDACSEESGWSTGMNSLTDEQIEQLYSQEVKVFECLKRLDRPTDQPPSIQTYRDGFLTADQYYAFGLIMDNPLLAGMPFEELVALCPPPTWFLNLDGF